MVCGSPTWAAAGPGREGPALALGPKFEYKYGLFFYN